MAEQNNTVTLLIYRFNPDTTKPPRYDRFVLKGITADDQLLDLLERIRHQTDSTVSYRKSCRHSICGSCAVKVNSVPVLACKSNARELITIYGNELTVDPLDYSRAERDLVINMDGYWEKYRSVRPYLEGIGGKTGPAAEGAGAPPRAQDRRIFPDTMDMVNNADYCIQCGACYYVCPVVRVNGKFLGPAALTKAYRFAADARDFSSKRLTIVQEQYSGVWDCAKCLLCVEACPKDINPFGKITALHEMGTDRGINVESEHYRHARVFNRQVRRTGYINEFFLALNTLRFGMRKMVLRGVLLVCKGKMRFNFLFPRSVKRYELRDILRKHKGGRR